MNYKRIIFFGISLALFGTLPAAAQTYVTFDVNGASETYGRAINKSGVVTGQYLDAGGRYSGYVRASDGTITVFDPANSIGTFPESINSNGDIAGFYYTASYDSYGFIRSSSGEIKQISPYGSIHTGLASINDAGSVTGDYEDASGRTHGFVQNRNGKVTTFDGYPLSINSSGNVVGSHKPIYHSFFREKDGTTINLRVPDEKLTAARVINNNDVIAGTAGKTNVKKNKWNLGFVRNPDGTYNTFATGADIIVQSINNRGVVVGGNDGGYHSFVYSDGTVTTFDPPNSTSSEALSVNDKGAVSGFYTDNKGVHGYIRMP